MPDLSETKPLETLWMVCYNGLRYFRVTVTERFKASDNTGNLVSISGYVDEVTAWDCDADMTPCEFERYLSFYMKWDECCHINFGEEDNPGYLHLCGLAYFQRHSQLMTELYEWASKEIPMRL